MKSQPTNFQAAKGMPMKVIAIPISASVASNWSTLPSSQSAFSPPRCWKRPIALGAFAQRLRRVGGFEDDLLGCRFDRLPRPMPDVFWIGLAIAVLFVLIGFVAGARSRTTKTLTGVAIGAYLGIMAAFPLLAIGLSTS
jgi:hypothetical protein